MLGFLVISFVKLILNPYPTMHDISVMAFMVLMNITFINSYVEGFVFLACAIFYGTLNTWFMTITWVHRFSGNANFLFFQIIALDVFLVVLFIQIYIGIDTKRKKYGEELL